MKGGDLLWRFVVVVIELVVVAVVLVLAVVAGLVGVVVVLDVVALGHCVSVIGCNRVV